MLKKKAQNEGNEAKRTDQEGEDESPYGEIRMPHLDSNDTKHKHNH
jgi:hypothetical protein